MYVISSAAIVYHINGIMVTQINEEWILKQSKGQW